MSCLSFSVANDSQLISTTPPTQLLMNWSYATMPNHMAEQSGRNIREVVTTSQSCSIMTQLAAYMHSKLFNTPTMFSSTMVSQNNSPVSLSNTALKQTPVAALAAAAAAFS